MCYLSLEMYMPENDFTLRPKVQRSSYSTQQGATTMSSKLAPLLLVEMSFVASSFLFLVVRPDAC